MKLRIISLLCISLLGSTVVNAELSLTASDIKKSTDMGYILSDSYVTNIECEAQRVKNNVEYTSYKRSECFKDGEGYKYFICKLIDSCIVGSGSVTSGNIIPDPNTTTSTAKIQNQDKLDKFITKVKSMRSSMGAVKYEKFLDLALEKLKVLGTKYSSNATISEMVSYLTKGTKEIKDDFLKNKDVDNFFCELTDSCNSSTLTQSTTAQQSTTTQQNTPSTSVQTGNEYKWLIKEATCDSSSFASKGISPSSYCGNMGASGVENGGKCGSNYYGTTCRDRSKTVRCGQEHMQAIIYSCNSSTLTQSTTAQQSTTTQQNTPSTSVQTGNEYKWLIKEATCDSSSFASKGISPSSYCGNMGASGVENGGKCGSNYYGTTCRDRSKTVRCGQEHMQAIIYSCNSSTLTQSTTAQQSTTTQQNTPSTSVQTGNEYKWLIKEATCDSSSFASKGISPSSYCGNMGASGVENGGKCGSNYYGTTCRDRSKTVRCGQEHMQAIIYSCNSSTLTQSTTAQQSTTTQQNTPSTSVQTGNEYKWLIKEATCDSSSFASKGISPSSYCGNMGASGVENGGKCGSNYYGTTCRDRSKTVRCGQEHMQAIIYSCNSSTLTQSTTAQQSTTTQQNTPSTSVQTGNEYKWLIKEATCDSSSFASKGISPSSYCGNMGASGVENGGKCGSNYYGTTCRDRSKTVRCGQEHMQAIIYSCN